jgi:hypothetical protein
VDSEVLPGLAFESWALGDCLCACCHFRCPFPNSGSSE